MLNIQITSRIKMVAAGVACAIQMVGTSAWAGETTAYFKPSYFTWVEKLNGANFVKEKGLIHTLGVNHKQMITSKVFGEGTLEVWGGSLDYDGHDVTGSTAVKSTTVYLGTREELAAGIKVPVAAKLTLEPFAGIGHKFWVRTRSSEDWNLIYGRVGAGIEQSSESWSTFAKGGIMMPFYTRSHVELSAAGYEDVVTSPEALPAAFAELGLKRAAWTVSIGYESMRFGRSASVPTKSTVAIQNGVAVTNNVAFQPDSRADSFSLKLEYRF